MADIDTDNHNFDLPTDEYGKAKVVKIYSFKRPHMRAFHFAWFSFFLAFFGWFALAPLQKRIRKNIPETSVWLDGGNKFKNQNIIAVAGTILMRFTIGPFCDRFGPRLAQSILLGVFSIPVFLVSTANAYWAWTTARFFIGFIGASFVVTQFWTSIMFSSNIVGTANATSAGWGNLGGGVTQAIMPLINKGMKRASNGDENRSWRLSMLVPGCALVITAAALFFLSDDLPQGNYSDLHKAGKKEKTNPFVSFGRAASNWRSWILFILYGACFGIELIMNGNLANYFSTEEENYGLNESTAGLVASLFGLMNLFARSIGGLVSDGAAKKFGMRGRLWVFFLTEFLEGIMFVIFSRISPWDSGIGAAIPTLLGFSMFVQMAEGATFGIVPFVDPPVTGAVSGIVGAGGNAGAVAGGFLLNPNERFGISTGFRNLGFIVIGMSFLIFLLWWPQYGSMLTKPTISANADVADDVKKEVATEELTEETETETREAE